MEQPLYIVISFLGGCLVTAVTFMFAFSGRLTKVETVVSRLCKDVDGVTVELNRYKDSHG